jgi:hypothetical protein
VRLLNKQQCHFDPRRVSTHCNDINIQSHLLCCNKSAFLPSLETSTPNNVLLFFRTPARDSDLSYPKPRRLWHNSAIRLRELRCTIPLTITISSVVFELTADSIFTANSLGLGTGRCYQCATSIHQWINAGIWRAFCA